MRRQVTPYLTTPSRLGNLWGEAGSRAQSELKQIRHTGAKREMIWANRF